MPLQDLEESEWEKRRNRAIARLGEVENTRIPSDFRGCSVGELLTVEKMTDLFTRHGFQTETDIALRLSPMESHAECYMDEDRMLFCVLNGVFIPMSASDKTLKEKRFWVTPSLDSVCWQTRSSSQVHRLPVLCIHEEVPFFGVL